MNEASIGKPEYRVPLMSEIVELPWNGLTVVSTFSGCGGSSLGYRIAGFKVLWASEFIEAARDSYRANMQPGTILDGRDIRTVKPEDILTACGLQVGQLDLLDGSPPCSSFSTAGTRHKGWGTVKRYSDTEQRTDDLFYEFIRLLRGVKPRTFVAENVSGLVKGVAKGFFKEVMRELKLCGYRVACKMLDAQWLGVPQQRERTIFVGVREDLVDKLTDELLQPQHPKPLTYRYSVKEAIPWICGVGKVPGGDFDKKGSERIWTDASEPSPTMTASCSQVPLVEGPLDKPLATVQAGAGGSTSSSFGHGTCLIPGDVEVSEDTFKEHRTYQDSRAPSIRAKKAGHLTITRVEVGDNGAFGEEKYRDGEVEPAATIGASPQSGNGLAGGGDVRLTQVEADADMTGYAVGAEADKLKPGEQSDKYFQLIRAPLDGSSPTVTADGGSTSLASVIHPVERRKFSIAELRRICAFPDDFILTGTYAQQWERLGRAVPPIMMFWIARTIRDLILHKADGEDLWPCDPECLLPKEMR